MKYLTKNLAKTIIVISLIIGSSICFSQSGNLTNQAGLMTIVKCIQHADRIIGSAFMLPPGWQAQCNTQYDLKDNTLWSDPIIQARNPNNNIQLFNDKSLHFYHNRQMRDQTLSSKSLDGVDISVFGPEFARSHQANTQEYIRIYDATYPEALDLVHFASTKPQELTHLQGYKVYHISRDPISQNISKLINNNNVTINVVTVIGHEYNNPNNIKMVKYIQAIIPIDRADHYTWHLHPMMAIGNKGNEIEMSKLINLVINTQQQNPKFTRMLAQVNQNMARQANKTFSNISNITAKTYSEISDIYHNTYKTVSASSERSHSNWVDGMLEVENYVNPFDGKQVKMPMHNKYYYTNNLDDYLGTNNPLFNPNTDLNYLYNWRKLERL